MEDIEKYSVLDIKKLFTKNTNINFLSEFTLQDLEDGKKRFFYKFYKDQEDVEKFQTFLDRACEKVIADKFSSGLQQTQGVVVKNTVRDTLNPDYKNTIHRLILIDSQYRPNLSNTETNYMVSLNDKIVNAVSLEITNIQIPYTFYNIESRQNNNLFTVTIDSTVTTVTIPDGHYDLSSVISSINTQLSSLSISFGQPSTTTGKITITNSNASACTINFIPIATTKVNTCLGWYLGFRSITGSTLVSANEPMALTFTIASSGTLTGSSIASVPITRYIVIAVDDFNKNQTADTMIQAKIDQEIIKPTNYYTQDPYLEYLTPDNVNSYLENMPNRTLTKAQVYTRAQQNQSRNNLSLQNLRLEVNSPNQVLAVFPFESGMTWGSTFFSDKCDYRREYHGPVDIDKLQIRIYDDKGILLNLNGGDWHMTLMTENLYKY